MSLPTSADIGRFSLFIRLTAISNLIGEARPELAKLTAVTGVAPMLTIELPKDRFGYDNSVVLARVATPYWLMIGPWNFDLISLAWSLSTTNEELRDALLAVYDACFAKTEIASPWRWAEAAQTTVVRVADGLTKCGVEVQGVVSANRLMPDQFEGADKARLVQDHLGDVLRVKMAWGIGTLARKATLGWVFDANDHLVTRRIDLGPYATGSVSPSPGWRTDDAEQLVQAIAKAVSDGQWDLGAGDPTRIDNYLAADPLDVAAAWWLRELGYSAVKHDGAGIRGPLNVITTTRRVGLAMVKTAFADAALAQKPLVMFAEGGYSKDASRWANEAAVALYEIDRESMRIFAASSLATEHIPQVV